MKKDIPKIVYLIYARDFLIEDNCVIACTLDKVKAEKILEKHESKRKITGEYEDGTPAYDCDYWISEEKLI